MSSSNKNNPLSLERRTVVDPLSELPIGYFMRNASDAKLRLKSISELLKGPVAFAEWRKLVCEAKGVKTWQPNCSNLTEEELRLIPWADYAQASANAPVYIPGQHALDNVDFSHTDFSQLSKSFKNLEKDKYLRLTRCNLQNTKWDHTSNVGIDLSWSDFSNASLIRAAFRGCVLHEIQGSDINFKGARFALGTDLYIYQMENVNFSGSEFFNMCIRVGRELKNAKFVGCRFMDVRFRSGIIRDSEFSVCEWDNESIEGVEFINCEFSNHLKNNEPDLSRARVSK